MLFFFFLNTCNKIIKVNSLNSLRIFFCFTHFVLRLMHNANQVFQVDTIYKSIIQ